MYVRIASGVYNHRVELYRRKVERKGSTRNTELKRNRHLLDASFPSPKTQKKEGMKRTGEYESGR
ncbi:hypothetical protein BDY24DRAFT_388876 [Mrakia frigida]|uniref:uncharacterized protein n=1 Tax=Mrakia frigida TaxID=29902 RepID=UPI003FCC1976